MARNQQRSGSRERVFLMVAVAVLLLALGWIGVYVMSGGRTAAPSDPAVIEAAAREHNAEAERERAKMREAFPREGRPAGETSGA